MAGEHGTKELLDYANALKVSGEQLEKVAEDGDLDVWDLRHLPAIYTAAKEAAEGTEEAKLEIKELSKEELQEVVTAFIAGGSKLIGGVNAVLATFKKES